jgi:hypothetical protein
MMMFFIFMVFCYVVKQNIFVLKLLILTRPVNLESL